MKCRNLVAGAALGLMLASSAAADTWNKKTKITFSGPVEVPGATLDAGTYIFKLLDSPSNRHIVTVMNERENHTYATILAIPDYRLNATSKTVMYFSERPAGQPQAVKSWFYPGDNTGQRFVYPKEKAVIIASSTSQPVPAYSAAAPTTVEETEKIEKFTVIEPSKEEKQYDAKEFERFDAADKAGVEGEAVRTTPPVVSQAPAQQPETPVTPQPQATDDSRLRAQAAPAPAEMPATASPIHLMSGLGGLLLGSSLIARHLASRGR